MKTACMEPCCPNEAVWMGRCRDHAGKNDRHARRDYVGSRVYNTAKWVKTRQHQLRRKPLCETSGCRAIATQVHHRQDLSDGGDPWDPENLESLCGPCHSKRTRSG